MAAAMCQPLNSFLSEYNELSQFIFVSNEFCVERLSNARLQPVQSHFFSFSEELQVPLIICKKFLDQLFLDFF